MLNFASFWIIAAASGGDAGNGKEEGGRYYLAEHGHYTEVSKDFFEYSRVHARSIWITHPLALLGGIWFYSRKKLMPA